MKIFAIIVASILLICPISFAQTWVNTNQGTFGWIAVTQMSDGSAIPSGSTVMYQPYVKTTSVSTPVKSGIAVAATQRTITFNEGLWLVGVSALRMIGTEAVAESSISWSDNPAVCQGGQTFGFRNYMSLAFPTLMRPIQ